MAQLCLRSLAINSRHNIIMINLLGKYTNKPLTDTDKH